VHIKYLVDLFHSQSMVSMMTSISNPNHDMKLSFNKTKIIGAKNQSRKTMIKNQSFSNGKLT
jgi:hypothetical protein